MGFYTKRLSLVDMMMIQVMVSLLRMFFQKRGRDNSHEKWQEANLKPEKGDETSWSAARELAGGKGHQGVFGSGKQNGT